MQFRALLALATASSATALSVLAAPALAFTITPNNSSTDLFTTLLGSTPGLRNFSVTTIGDTAAFGTFNAAPFGFGSGVVLSTGRVIDIPGVNSIGGTVGSFDGDASTDLSDENDDIRLNISFDADSTADRLLLQYVFASEEFVESAANNLFGAGFNDLLEISLNGTNLAKLSDGKAVSIGTLVPVAAGPFHPDYVNNPAGANTSLTLDGYTKVLTFEGLLNKGTTNSLSIRVADVGDDILDSAVFLKGGSLSAEAVPEPFTIGGTLVAAVVGLQMRLRRK